MVRTIWRGLVVGLLMFCGLALRPALAADAASPEAKRALAVFRLSGVLSESAADEGLPFFSPPGTSLRTLIERLHKAANDPAVPAVVLLCDDLSIGQAQIEEVRQAIKGVRDAGKEVFVHADSLGMGQYTLLSAASRISLTPTGDLWLTGIAGEQLYLRGLLNKLGVQPDFLTCGEYKSAGEMFMREGPSPEADRMTNWLLDGIYSAWVAGIAQGRQMEPQKVQQLIDDGPYSAQRAKEAGLIDEVEQRQDFAQMLHDRYGAEVTFDKRYGAPKQPTIDFSSPFGVLKFYGELLGGARKPKSTKPAVAIVYVEGPIMVGDGEASIFSMGGVAASNPIRRALDKAASDDTVKAVVLRVNSPGGSATASEIILNATRGVKAHKPLIVSMGDVAGSGGYYVAMGADTIFADEATITASIGVVMGKFVTTDMWRKVGVAFKPYHRGRNAGILSSDSAFSAEQRERMQAHMDEIYKIFRDHVTQARGDKLKKPLDELAGGRVFTGRQALDLGLIDKIGTLRDAIAHAAGEAKVTDYEVRILPEPKNFIELLMASMGQDEGDPANIGMAGISKHSTSLADLAMPYLQHLDPARVRAVRSAMLQLDLLKDEGALLTTPPLLISR